MSLKYTQGYSASRGFSLTWLLAFTESFAPLVFIVVVLFNFIISLLLISAVINTIPKDGTFKITGNGVEGEGTFTASNGKAEIGLHISLTGQGSTAQLVVPAPDLADKGEPENTFRTTDGNDNTETEITFTQDGKIRKIRLLKGAKSCYLLSLDEIR